LPGNPLIAVPCARILLRILGHIGPNKNTDVMFTAAIDQSGDRAPLKNGEPAPDERETPRGKIGNRRGKGYFPVKPWFNGVLVLRNDVGQMAWLQGADVRVNKFRSS